MEPQPYKKVAPANAKTLARRPTVPIPKSAQNNLITLVEKEDFLTTNQKWLLFYTLLGGTIIVAFTYDVPAWFQITALVLLFLSWLPKTLWNHRAVFIENKMTTLASVLGLIAMVCYLFINDPELRPRHSWSIWLFALWFIFDSVSRYLKKRHGSF